MEGGIDATSTYEQQRQQNRMEMLKAFDDTKAGVKGLVDSGISKVPEIFFKPSEDLNQESTQVQVPTIDLNQIDNADRRKPIVEQVRIAAETWGFFQVVNHGIPQTVLDATIDGIRHFIEQDVGEKRKYYTRDNTRSVRYFSSHDLFMAKTASWRDTLNIAFNSDTDSSDRDQLPPTCRESAVEFSKNVEILGNTLLGLLSEALGLQTDHLKNMEISDAKALYGHYYPACPEPELAIGTMKHADAGFLTILIQDQTVSVLQVLYHGRWVDIQSIRGSIVVNIGDLLQLVSNGKFKSIEHRVKASRIGPRISVAYFFSGSANRAKIYGPIEELISEENPPVYTDIVLGEYFMKFRSTGLDNYRALDYYKLSK